MNKSNEQQKLKLIENITYNIRHTTPSIGWKARFSNVDKPFTIIYWATVNSHHTSPNGLNNEKVVGLVDIGSGNIVPCDLVKTFKNYIEPV